MHLTRNLYVSVCASEIRQVSCSRPKHDEMSSVKLFWKFIENISMALNQLLRNKEYLHTVQCNSRFLK